MLHQKIDNLIQLQMQLINGVRKLVPAPKRKYVFKLWNDLILLD